MKQYFPESILLNNTCRWSNIFQHCSINIDIFWIRTIYFTTYQYQKHKFNLLHNLLYCAIILNVYGAPYTHCVAPTLCTQTTVVRLPMVCSSTWTWKIVRGIGLSFAWQATACAPERSMFQRVEVQFLRKRRLKQQTSEGSFSYQAYKGAFNVAVRKKVANQRKGQLSNWT